MAVKELQHHTVPGIFRQEQCAVSGWREETQWWNVSSNYINDCWIKSGRKRCNGKIGNESVEVKLNLMISTKKTKIRVHCWPKLTIQDIMMKKVGKTINRKSVLGNNLVNCGEKSNVQK